MANDVIWRDVHTRSQRHPVAPQAHGGDGGGGGGGGTWRSAYEAGLRTDGNWRRRRCVRSEHAHHEAYINCVHKWDDCVLTASADHTLCLWALQPRCALPCPPPPDQLPRADGSLRQCGGGEGVEATTTTADASSSAAGYNSGGVNGSSVAQAGHEATPIRRFVGHIDHVTCVTTVAEHTRVLSAAADGQLMVWDVVTGDVVQSRRVVRHAGSLSAAAQEREVPSPHFCFLDSHPGRPCTTFAPPRRAPHTSGRWQARVLVGSLNAENPPLQLCELATLRTARQLDWYGPVAEVYDVAMERNTAVRAAPCPSKHSMCGPHSVRRDARGSLSYSSANANDRLGMTAYDACLHLSPPPV